MKSWSLCSHRFPGLLIILLMPCIANALTIDWVRQLGTSNYDRGTAVATDRMGSIYVAGSTGGSLASPFAGSYYDAFLSKYDAAGNVRWTRQLGTSGSDEANGVVTDNDGNVYIAGYTSGKLGNARVAAGDSFVSKFDADGNLIWTSQFGTNVSPYASQASTSIATDGLGSLYVTGRTAGDEASSHIDAFVTKLDHSGNVIWTQEFGSDRDETGEAIAVDALGNIFVAGIKHRSFFSDPERFTYSSDAFIAKFDVTGTLVWTRNLGAPGWDFGFAAAADGTGNVFLAGATDGHLGDDYGGGFHDAFLAKYDSDGNTVWIRQLGGEGADEAYGLTLDSKGGVYITGNTDRLTDADQSPRIGNSFVAKYDTDGTLLWAEELGEPGARAISFDNVSGLFVCGRTHESLYGQNAGYEDAFLAKVSSVPEPPTALLSAIVASMFGVTRKRSY